MDVDLTDDQELFRSTTRRFLETASPLTNVRALEAHPDGFDPGYWRQGAELGWTSMLVPEADGGGSLSGDGLRDLVIVAEEMGRLVAPGPLVPTSVVAAAVAESGSAHQRAAVLPPIVAGESIATWAFGESGMRWDPTRLTCVATATSDGFVITGTKSPVEAAAQAGLLLVTARLAGGGDDGRLAQFLVAPKATGVRLEALDSIDLNRRYAAVHFDGVEVPASAMLGDPSTAGAMVERQLQIASVLQCAETSGAIDHVLAFTIEYLGDRYSFGRPLSSYQALKHRLADMKLWVEGCLAITSGAAMAVQHRSDDASEMASAAAAYVGAAAVEIVQDCIQLHGGIGLTWEHDLHLYLRRVTINHGMYGSPIEHRERIASLVGLTASRGSTTGAP